MRQKLNIRLLIAFSVISLVVSQFLPGYLLNYLAGALLLAALAAVSDLVWGYGGILLLGPALFFGIGSYAFAICARQGISLWAALGLNWLFVLTLCACVFIPAIYRGIKTIQFGLISLIVCLIFQQLVISLYDLAGGSNGLSNFSTNSARVMGMAIPYTNDHFLYFLALALSLVTLITLLLIERSLFGKLLSCIQDSPLRAATIGYDLPKYRSYVFVFGALMSSTLGLFYAPVDNIVHPGAFSVTTNVIVLVWITIGGRRTLMGPFFAAIVLKLIEYWLGSSLTDYYLLFIGALLILCVLFFKKGLYAVIPRSPWLKRKEGAHAA